MTENSDKVGECLDKIDAASRQLLSVVNDVLDMSKIEAGKLELAKDPFNLMTALSGVCSILGSWAAEKGLALETDFAPDLPEIVVGDDTRLSQVLINLVSNAVKFTPEGGRIRLRAHRIPGEGGSDELEISVEDTGIGISEQEQDRLFKKFEQADRSTSRRFGGTGLGLAICKSIVELMDGAISVWSEPGQGSRFTIRFPYTPGESEALSSAARPEISVGAYDFSGKRVLLVEDLEINREIVKTLLKDTGLLWDEAKDGQIAVEMFSEAPGRYDLIFMDIHMPVMDGYEATRQIRALPAAPAGEVPIVAMTANAFSEDVRRCREAGMNDHIAKPIDLGMLLEKTKRYLGG